MDFKRWIRTVLGLQGTMGSRALSKTLDDHGFKKPSWTYQGFRQNRTRTLASNHSLYRKPDNQCHRRRVKQNYQDCKKSCEWFSNIASIYGYDFPLSWRRWYSCTDSWRFSYAVKMVRSSEYVGFILFSQIGNPGNSHIYCIKLVTSSISFPFYLFIWFEIRLAVDKLFYYIYFNSISTNTNS